MEQVLTYMSKFLLGNIDVCVALGLAAPKIGKICALMFGEVKKHN